MLNHRKGIFALTLINIIHELTYQYRRFFRLIICNGTANIADIAINHVLPIRLLRTNSDHHHGEHGRLFDGDIALNQNCFGVCVLG